MKQTIFLCLLMAFSSIASAQNYDSATRYLLSPSFSVAVDTLVARAVAANPTDTGEGSKMMALSRFKNFMGSRISYDVAAGTDMYAPMSMALSTYSLYSGSCSSLSNWQPLGPFTNYYGVDSPAVEHQGRINSIWVNNLSGTILAGADGGGLWRSYDNGNHWRNITDGLGANNILGMPGVTCVAVNPMDTNIIYINLKMFTQYAKSQGSYDLGLVYTTDGGAHWQTDTAFADTVISVLPEVEKVAYMPGTQKLFAITQNSGVYYKASPADTWHNITPALTASVNPNYTGLDFSRQTPGKVIVTCRAVNWPPSWGPFISNMWVCDAGSLSPTGWTQIELTPSGYGSPYEGGAVRFAMSSTDSAYIEYDAGSGLILFKTPITSFSPTILNTSFSGTVQDFAVSQSNSNIIYAANYDGYLGEAMLRSTDNGASFYYYSYSHADGRCVFIRKDSTNNLYDEVYVGNDGGIREKRPGHDHFDCITGDSLAVTEFYGFGNTEADENIMAGGAQDVGEFAYIKTNATPWSQVGPGGDGNISKFMNNGVTDAFGEARTPYREMYQLDFTGGSITEPGVATPPATIDPTAGSGPIQFILDTLAIMGCEHVWQKCNSCPAWSRYFLADPIDKSDTTFPKTVADFYIDEHDNDSVYIAYTGATFGPEFQYHDPSVDTFGKLYFSNNAMSTNPLFPPFWTNISPSICSTNQINSICVDPQHSNRIWVAFGNVNNSMVGANPDTMKNRVLYSDNSGGSWVDVSTGLSALPVNKLLYRKGSNDEIYAGTDVGVFQWNPATNSWQCFNNGLPTCIVMDMEMNYCAGKLRVATYGRGIWETPVGNITPLPDTATTVITGATTWSQNMWLENSVTVMNGGVLTITGDTIHMPRMGVIAVEPGGHLIVNHAEITNSCDFCWWKGIEARGQVLLPQIPTSNQGWVTIENGSTIQHAVTGVRNSNADVVWSENGGIIQAFSSYFIDNVSDADFDGYDNWVGGVLNHNLSHFNLCTFLQDNNYKGNLPGFTLENMVNLHSVEGISFAGCQFLNRDTLAISRLVGEGIDAVNSDFYVSAACATSWPPCFMPGIRSRFCGFTNGIMVHGIYQPGLAPSIDNADFDSVSVGVNVEAFNDVSTTRCNFIVGHGLSVADVTSPSFTGCYQNIGILTQNTNQFRMEGNNFIGKPNTSVSNWYNFGTVVSNSGPYTNTVYRNTFDSLTEGIYALGINNDNTLPMPMGQGLKIFCNAFSKNSSDIYVDDTASGISTTQGIFIPATDSFVAAGNTFTGSTKNICNIGVNIDYYYHTSIYALNPDYPFDLCYSSGPSPSGNVNLFGVDSENTCPSSFAIYPAPYPGPVGIFPTPLTGHKQAFFTDKTAYQDSLAVYNSRMDFGNPDSLITIIQRSSDTAALYTTLSSGSPYISESALTDVGSLSKLPYYSMMQILKQNPDDLHDNTFMTNMKAAYGLSAADMDTLVAWSVPITNRTTLMWSIGASQSAASQEANLIMMALGSPIDTNMTLTDDSTWSGICGDSTSVYYLLDSSTYYVGFDSIDTWLQNIGGLWTNYERAGYYNFLNQPNTANNIFNGIGNSLPAGTRPDTATYLTCGKVWNAIYDAESAGRNLYSLDSDEIASLDTSSVQVFSYNTGLGMITGITPLINPNTHNRAQIAPCIRIIEVGPRSSNNGANQPPPLTNNGNKCKFRSMLTHHSVLC